MIAYLLLVFLILMSTTAQVFLKKGMLKLGKLDISFLHIFNLISRIFKNPWLVGGIIFFGMGFVFYLFVLAKLQLNIVYPITVSGVIILISLASRFLFKEFITSRQALGIVIIISGIFLLVIK